MGEKLWPGGREQRNTSGLWASDAFFMKEKDPLRDVHSIEGNLKGYRWQHLLQQILAETLSFYSII